MMFISEDFLSIEEDDRQTKKVKFIFLMEISQSSEYDLIIKERFSY